MRVCWREKERQRAWNRDEKMMRDRERRIDKGRLSEGDRWREDKRHSDRDEREAVKKKIDREIESERGKREDK